MVAAPYQAAVNYLPNGSIDVIVSICSIYSNEFGAKQLQLSELARLDAVNSGSSTPV
jgi:hypothetical protein